MDELCYIQLISMDLASQLQECLDAYHRSMNLSTVSGDPSLKSSTIIWPLDVFRIYKGKKNNIKDKR